jgi:tRNA splicing endonuclease
MEKTVKIGIADREGKFAIVCDASLKGIGGILIQEEPKMKLLGGFSKTLGKHEKNYSTIEKELYSIVKCLENWRYILHGTRLPISVYTDHKNLLNYRKIKIREQKHVMWWQILYEYNIEMKFIEGKENVVVDHLSRNNCERENDRKENDGRNLKIENAETLYLFREKEDEQMNTKTMKLESDMLLHGISMEEDDDDETYDTIKMRVLQRAMK